MRIAKEKGNMIYLKNPPSSLRYATRSQYLAAIMTLVTVADIGHNVQEG
jgi:hypothetical protein